MKGKLFVLIIILVGFCVGSCSKRIAPTENSVLRDTLTITQTVIERDTVFFLPQSSVSYNMPSVVPPNFVGLKDAKKGIIEKQDGQANLKMTYFNKNVQIDCICDTARLKAKLYDTFLKENRKTVSEKTIIKKVKYTPRIVKILAWLGGIFCLLIGFKMLRIFKVV